MPQRSTSDEIVRHGRRSTEMVTIEPLSRWRLVDLREVLDYRDLFWFLVYRSIRSRYAQSALGISWAVIQPVMTMVVFTVVFGKMVKVSSDGVPYAVFSFAALVPWNYFQTALTEAVQTLVTEKNMVSKVYFPRVILPISRILARLLDFAIGLVILAGFLLFFRMTPNVGALMLLPLTLVMAATATGIGLLLSAMAVQYRDINYAMTFVARLLMYAAPVVYPASLVPDHYRILYGLNPMVGVIEGFRSGLLGTTPMPWDLIVPGVVVSGVLLVFGAVYFRRKERLFADVA